VSTSEAVDIARTKIEIKPALALSDKLHFKVGALDGVVLGSEDEAEDSSWDGVLDGSIVVFPVGAGVGLIEGREVGDFVCTGPADGFSVVLSVGSIVEPLEGAAV
jgi:hypothetical protein